MLYIAAHKVWGTIKWIWLALISLFLTTLAANLAVLQTKDFVGRRFLFDEVDEWVKSSTIQSGYLVIEAEPGFGKTAFIAALVKRSGWMHHYVDLKRGINKPQEFLQNVCAQLIIRYKLP